MSKIGAQVIQDMEDYPELYDTNNDQEPDYNPANFVPIPIAELNKLIDESLPF